MQSPSFDLYAQDQCIAQGDLSHILTTAHAHLDRGDTRPLLALCSQTGEMLEMDLRGTLQDVLGRIPPAVPPLSGPGRPKLGVIGKEITLLPRHWEWLNSQSGGASVTLRKLVESAIKESASKDKDKSIVNSTYKYMWNCAGSMPNYEEASRALFAQDLEAFKAIVQHWGDKGQNLIQMASGLKQ